MHFAKGIIAGSKSCIAKLILRITFGENTIIMRIWSKIY